jgi:hypothetical protein
LRKSYLPNHLENKRFDYDASGTRKMLLTTESNVYTGLAMASKYARSTLTKDYSMLPEIFANVTANRGEISGRLTPPGRIRSLLKKIPWNCIAIKIPC